MLRFRQILRRFALIAGFTLTANAANAALVTFNLLDPTGTGGTAGEGLEASGMFADSGVTIADSVSTTLGSGTGFFSASGSNAGVNSDGVTGGGGDEASELDAGETLTLTFSFSGLNVALTEIDFSGVGSAGGGDAALVTINADPQVTLETGASGFAGGSDTWTPSPILLSSGDTIMFDAQDRISISSVTLDVTAVPEPSSLMALLVGGLCSSGLRRRRRA